MNDNDYDETYDLLLEAYPEELEAALEEVEAERQELAELDVGLEFIVADLDKWPAGDEITVAFLGGDSSLHGDIASVCAEIDDSCGITLDFGNDGSGGPFRTWSESDTEYAADIRISFDRSGFWSLVGTASIDRGLTPSSASLGGAPHQRSMNFGGFTTSRPPSWRRTVLHEFLHALAFKHEHQNMRGQCQQEFRWEDDEGYVPTTNNRGTFVPDSAGRRPGIYTYLSGPPNEWSRSKVDHNLRSAGAEDAVASQFDPESVMLYRFAPFFYKSDPSPCAPTSEGDHLSDGDKRGLKLLYPDVADAARSESAQGALELVKAHQASLEGLESVDDAAMRRMAGLSGVLDRLAR